MDNETSTMATLFDNAMVELVRAKISTEHSLKMAARIR